MCQAGINTADYKVAIHQLQEIAKLLGNSSEQWARLASSAHQDELSNKLSEAAAKSTEIGKILEAAFEDVHDHTHPHVHIS
jgi:ABC-type Fe3+-citrate transport system substrate-binding protein